GQSERLRLGLSWTSWFSCVDLWGCQDGFSSQCTPSYQRSPSNSEPAESLALFAIPFQYASRDPASDGIPPKTARVSRTLYRKDDFLTIFRPRRQRRGDLLRSQKWGRSHFASEPPGSRS